MAKAKTPGTAMTKWQEELAARAKQKKAVMADVGGGSNFIKTQGGMFSYKGGTAEKLTVVILDYVRENAYYGADYDPDNPLPPVCFALNDNPDEMAPHENSTDKQNDTCEGCPLNEFGSADKGAGKACKNTARLALISEDEIEDPDKAEIALLKLPVTSMKNFKAYIDKLDESYQRPPLGVLTEIATVRDAKTQFKITFKMVEAFEDGDLIEALMAKADDCKAELLSPYSRNESAGEDEAPRAGKARVAGGRASAGKAAPAKGGRAAPPARRR